MEVAKTLSNRGGGTFARFEEKDWLEGSSVAFRASRGRAPRVRRHRTRGMFAFLAAAPPGRHRAVIPAWYRIVPAVLLLTAVAPAVASMVPDDPAPQIGAAVTIDPTAPTTAVKPVSSKDATLAQVTVGCLAVFRTNS